MFDPNNKQQLKDNLDKSLDKTRLLCKVCSQEINCGGSKVVEKCMVEHCPYFNDLLNK